MPLCSRWTAPRKSVFGARALKSYGLPHMLRVSIGNDEENAAFLAAMKDIVDSGC